MWEGFINGMEMRLNVETNFSRVDEAFVYPGVHLENNFHQGPNWVIDQTLCMLCRGS